MEKLTIKKRIEYFLYDIKSKWNEIREWNMDHFTKDCFNVFKELWNGHPWDESFLLKMERAKLIEISNYIERKNRYVGCEYDVRDMRICIKLIGIILEEGNLFHFDGHLDYEKMEDENYEIKADNLKYVCDIKVNTKNIDRFIENKKAQKAYLRMPHDLYIRKARYLYFKIRYERGMKWWD